MVREDDRAFERPRGQAWGNEAQRAVLHAIAEDVARRAGHHVAVIEALRSGDPATRDRPGTGLGLSILERVVRRMGDLRGHLGGWSRYDVRGGPAVRGTGMTRP